MKASHFQAALFCLERKNTDNNFDTKSADLFPFSGSFVCLTGFTRSITLAGRITVDMSLLTVEYTRRNQPKMSLSGSNHSFTADDTGESKEHMYNSITEDRVDVEFIY